MQKNIAIISTGHTFPNIKQQYGDFHDWIAQHLDNDLLAINIDAKTISSLPLVSDFSGIILTGSHSMVSDQEPWSENLALWLRNAIEKEIPILGICYGHQLLAHSVGGQVGYNPNGIEIGTHDIYLKKEAETDPILNGLPASFPAHLVHSQSVLSLPKDATILAHNSHERHQAFRIGKCAWGVQFHPEFSDHAMKSYIDNMQDTLEENGINWKTIKESVKRTNYSTSILVNFSNFIYKKI